MLYESTSVTLAVAVVPYTDLGLLQLRDYLAVTYEVEPPTLPLIIGHMKRETLFTQKPE